MERYTTAVTSVNEDFPNEFQSVPLVQTIVCVITTFLKKKKKKNT